MSVQQKKVIGETFECENILTSSRNAHLKAPKDSRGKGSHEKFLTVLFHEYPPDTLESTNNQRGKMAGKASKTLVSKSFSSDIGSKSKLRDCHTPKPSPTTLTTKNKEGMN